MAIRKFYRATHNPEGKMRKIRVLFILFFILSVIVSDPGWCALTTFIDPSKPVEVKKGEDFLLAVPSNPATGYSWGITGSFGAPQLKYIGSNYDPAQSNMAGEGGTEWFRFLAIAEGKTEVCLRCQRVSEKDKPPAREAKFQVQVS